MPIIEKLKQKKVIEKVKLVSKIDEDLLNNIKNLCEKNDVDFDEYINEALLYVTKKELAKNKRAEKEKAKLGGIYG